MMNYLSPNDPKFQAESDAISIQNAINQAEIGPIRTVVIPRVCARTGAEEWIIDKSILLPSNVTIVLEDCHLTLKEGVYENIFRNKNMYTETSTKVEGKQSGIRIIGVGEAILDGCGVDAPGSLVAWMCKKSIVYAMEMPGSRYDIGNLESYEKECKEYKGIC